MIDWRIAAVAVGAIIAFTAAFRVSGLVKRAAAAASAARHALAAISDPGLADEEKERVVRSAALQLFVHFALITLLAAAVLVAPLVVLWVGDLSGIAPFATVFKFLLKWEVIVGATLLLFAASWLARRH